MKNKTFDPWDDALWAHCVGHETCNPIPDSAEYRTWCSEHLDTVRNTMTIIDEDQYRSALREQLMERMKAAMQHHLDSNWLFLDPEVQLVLLLLGESPTPPVLN